MEESIIQVLRWELTSLASRSPSLAVACEPLIERVYTPPRIVLVGRLKAGKSTLLNALIGAEVARTAALEATNVVAAYQNGAPERAEFHLHDGSVILVPTRRDEIAVLPAPAAEISYVDRFLPSDAVRSYTLIDTPGLATLTEENEAATRAMLTESFKQTRDASTDADAAVFLFDAIPRQDEVEFIRELGFTPLNTLGVLSRADSYGAGALGAVDPVDEAARHAARLERELARYVDRVIPVSGLLAQTAATGALNESLTRRIAAVTASSRVALLEVMYEEQPADPRQAREVAKIIDLIGEYGLFRGADAAARGATALTKWLLEASGMNRLRSALEGELSSYAQLHRAGVIIQSLEALAYQYPEDAAEIRRSVSAIKRHPAALPARLIVALKTLQVAGASDEFIREAKLLAARGPAAIRLGLDPGAGAWEALDTLRAKRTRMQTLAFGLLDPAEEEAMVAINEAYEQLERELSESL